MRLALNLPPSIACAELNQAKRGLIELMAEEKSLQRSINELKTQISDYEACARTAMNRNEDDLAEEIAIRITQIESMLASREMLLMSFSEQVGRLKESVMRLHRRLFDPLEDLHYLLDRLEAADELETGFADIALERRMRAAGIGRTGRTGQEILERIRRRR